MSLSILMDTDTKELKITKRAKIRQGESLADKLYLILPMTYDDVSLEEFTVALLYTDAANVSHMELLERDSDIYKDNYYRYTLPLDSDFTKMAGSVTMQLSLTHQDTETDESYVIHSGQIKVTVLSWSDYYAFVPSTSLNAIDQKLLQIDSEIQEMKATSEAYDKARATDLNLKGDLLQLVNQNGEVFGDGVNVAVEYPDVHDDNPTDGEIVLGSDGDTTNG